jgi:hypothetical protein
MLNVSFVSHDPKPSLQRIEITARGLPIDHFKGVAGLGSFAQLKWQEHDEEHCSGAAS